MPVEPPPISPAPRPTRLHRSRSDSVLGGVCGGLGAVTGVDPVWFRLGFIFLTLSSGIGFLLYLVAWIVIPEADEDEPIATANVNNGAVVFGIFLLVAGSALMVDAIVPWFDRVIWPLAVIGVGVGLLYFGSSVGRRA